MKCEIHTTEKELLPIDELSTEMKLICPNCADIKEEIGRLKNYIPLIENSINSSIEKGKRELKELKARLEALKKELNGSS